MSQTRVVVVGAGNAALCAALAAAQEGADVVILEAASVEERGGNSAFTAGAMRVVYESAERLRELMPDLTDDEFNSTDFGTYPAEKFYEDMGRVTEYRCDPEMVEVLVTKSFETLRWMQSLGVKFFPSYGRQAFAVNGRFKFWGGLSLEASGGGPGLVEALSKAAEAMGVTIKYQHRAVELIEEHGRVIGVTAKSHGESIDFLADSVVLASGGFEANTEWRTRYLGPRWDLAKVRGSRFNMGDGIRMALDIGAISWGNWSGCHAVGWDYNAPPFGDLAVGDGFQKHSYPFGVMVNLDGRRFVDEGADFRNYTYAKYGRTILEQPGQVAWQIFDSKVSHLLRDEYRIREVTRVRADSLEDLATQMTGMDVDGFLQTITDYNRAVMVDKPFSPTIRDGRGTDGLALPKSNWANTIDTPPFEGYAVTCGVTFTFGGLRIDEAAGVVDVDGRTIPGLYACGELVGGLFYFNYPGGTGLTSGAVFGRLAGRSSASGSIDIEDTPRVHSVAK
jgi:tricarballylate dehydrogenase